MNEQKKPLQDDKGRFLPGNTTGGRTPLPPEIKEISRQTKPAIIKAYWKISNLSEQQLTEFKPETLLEAGITRCMAEFARNGKSDQVRHIWAECHGKPTESIDHGGEITKRVIVEIVKPDEN